MLSKSKILAYLQCPKRLWLEVHQPESRTDSGATTASFATGHAVGDASRTIYDPDGTGIFLDIKALGLKGLMQPPRQPLLSAKPYLKLAFKPMAPCPWQIF